MGEQLIDLLVHLRSIDDKKHACVVLYLVPPLLILIPRLSIDVLDKSYEHFGVEPGSFLVRHFEFESSALLACSGQREATSREIRGLVHQISYRIKTKH